MWPNGCSGHGVAAFVLKYRLARQKDSKYTVEGTELGDMQRAIRTVRSRSKEWGIDPERIGVMGFSAGGELAALASTRYDEGLPSSDDPSGACQFQAELPGAALSCDSQGSPAHCGDTASLPGLRGQRPAGYCGRLAEFLSRSHPSPRISRTPYLCGRRPWFWRSQDESSAGFRLDFAFPPVAGCPGAAKTLGAVEKLIMRGLPFWK